MLWWLIEVLVVDRVMWTDCDDSSEEQLLAQARRGDEIATERLFDRYFPLLRDRVRRRMPARLKRKIGASDVIQDAYLAAVRRLAEFQDRGKGSFGGWLITIVDRKLSDQAHRYLGTKKRDAKRELTRGDSQHGLSAATDDPSVCEGACRTEAIDSVMTAVKRLPPRDRRLVELIHFEGQTIAHAAELDGCTVDAARMRYSRALVRLRKLMNASGESPA